MAESPPLSIELKDGGKRFRSHWIFAHVDLSVRRGESIALFGKNGSGKSTLLKMIATLLRPTVGQLKVLGLESTRQQKEIRMRLRYLSHEKQLYGTLTVMENMRFAAGILDLPQRKIDLTIEGLLERMGLRSFHNHRVEELSAGTKKRLMMARLLLGDCDLVLLDEPHATLDSSGKEILSELITDWRNSGKTILLTSHSTELALPHADRVLTLSGGRLLEKDGA